MDVEAGVLALQIARAVVRHAVPQRQILRARRRSNRVCLHETEFIERFRQGRRSKEAPRDSVPAQFVDGQSKSIITSENLRRTPVSAQARRVFSCVVSGLLNHLAPSLPNLLADPDRTNRLPALVQPKIGFDASSLVSEVSAPHGLQHTALDASGFVVLAQLGQHHRHRLAKLRRLRAREERLDQCHGALAVPDRGIWCGCQHASQQVRELRPIRIEGHGGRGPCRSFPMALKMDERQCVAQRACAAGGLIRRASLYGARDARTRPVRLSASARATCASRYVGWRRTPPSKCSMARRESPLDIMMTPRL